MMKKNFTAEDWQQIITNWLASQEAELKDFPTWKFILQELNIHQKCNSSLKNDLRIWYKSYCNYQAFPPQPVNLPEGIFVLAENATSKIKTKTVFDVNKNLVKIILPANLKLEITDMEEKKKEILNYLQDKNIYLPPKWTDISHSLNYNYIYTLESREPLKIFYNEYRQECFEKWKKENKTKDSFSIKNKSIEVLTDNSDLKNNLVLIFNQIKNQLVNNSIYTDSKLIKYYEIFFQQFTPKILKKNCVINHGSQGLAIINGFHNVSNLKDFKHYLDSIPGLYPKMVSWTIQNPFPVKELQIEHHAMPKFLNKYGFNLQKKIEKPYNVVYISRIIHYLMHLVRWIEYLQFEDGYAVQLMLRHQNSNTSISWVSNQIQNIAQVMYESVNNLMLKNYPDYEKQISKERKKQIGALAIVKMAPETKKILICKTIWRCLDDETFQFIHFPQKDDNCSLKDFTLAFIKAYHNHQKVSKQKLFFKEKNDRWTRERFGKYMRGKITKVYDKFYLVDPPEFIKKLEK